MSERGDAAIEVAHRLGLAVAEPAVLRDLTATLVHLAPSPVVARVWEAGRREPAGVQREIQVTAYLGARGARVAAPYDDPGPHLVHVSAGDLVVTLWHHVDHDPARPLDGRAAGLALREIHDLLAERGVPGTDGLPHFVRLDEAVDVVSHLDVAGEDRERLEEMLGLAADATARLDLPLQPLHGDAWLGNVLRTPQGLLWTDFENLCRGPREVDLAANETVSRQRGRKPVDDDFLDGYGDVDRDLVAALAPLALVPYAAWTFRLAGDRPEYLDAARFRLATALEGLRATSNPWG